MPSSGLMLSNGSVVGNGGRMDGTLSQSMDSVNTVAAEEEVPSHLFHIFFFLWLLFLFHGAHTFFCILFSLIVWLCDVNASVNLSADGDPFFIFSLLSFSFFPPPHHLLSVGPRPSRPNDFFFLPIPIYEAYTAGSTALKKERYYLSEKILGHLVNSFQSNRRIKRRIFLYFCFISLVLFRIA